MDGVFDCLCVCTGIGVNVGKLIKGEFYVSRPNQSLLPVGWVGGWWVVQFFFSSICDVFAKAFEESAWDAEEK